MLILFLPPIIYGEEDDDIREQTNDEDKREREQKGEEEPPIPMAHFPAVLNIQETAESSSQSDFCWDFHLH